MAYSNDGKLLVSGSDDKTLKLWTTINDKYQYSINAHSHWVRSALFSPDS